MAHAVAHCATRGARLTPLRRRVLEILWRRHAPAGAYAILGELEREGYGGAPPTVYRALDFLLAQGLAHRISSRNAFVACDRPGHPGCGQFLICAACGNAAELHDGEVEQAIARSAAAQGFAAERHTIEITGLCPRCR
ncbi:MAG: Fur family transcriptional regulator [Gammaproteobacteria bacterium]|nr:Fur family transcriptional regulator [Gammaproteobacteria bacterium]